MEGLQNSYQKPKKFQVEILSPEELEYYADPEDYTYALRYRLPQEGFITIILLNQPPEEVDVDEVEETVLRRYEREKQNIVQKWALSGDNQLMEDYDENGVLYFYCDLDPALFGKPVRITGRDLGEMRLRFEMARDALVEQDKRGYATSERTLWGFYTTVICPEEYETPFDDEESYERWLAEKEEEERQKTDIERESDELQDMFWELLELAVFGSDEEHRFARRFLRDMVSPAGIETFNRDYCDALDHHDDRKILLKQMDAVKPADDRVFQDFLTQAIDIDRKFSENSLAEKIGCAASTISRIRSGGTQQPRKRLVLQIGVAIGVPADQFRQFVLSSGHQFPTTKADIVILDCLRKGIKNYDKIMFEASRYDGSLYRA